ncbi:HAD-IG family 5'-nucleotidase [Chondromyces apiculatus]|uniref:HAD superfamily (Subfamily IG) hydrolase, 5'-Nucleotidase n=1 Tax=Chondromyces apiculatus DSM 436 TaxID=1192034 RepID=A0A017TEE5_9BACT|nr:HAD-IG family 5'-nucleotidase [Chondromyces apiculatus]EYF07658.1 HAD superfamily (Subfamily IG) hydrolase, 5'-Nucleotidase [Chondromyces apiculatus DSM 436]
MAFEQLDLPLGGVSPPTEPTRIPRTRRVFVNRHLRLGQIDWVGFDMDYTLAIYNQTEMDTLSIQGTLSKLASRGYPEDVLRHISYPVHFPMRGLLIDKRHGHVLKMDRFKVVQKGYHGMRELSKEEIRSLYQHRKIRTNTGRYHWIDTLYALSEATLYAGIVAALEARGTEVDYARLFTDIRECIDEAHRDGTIVDVVMNDLPRFIERDPLLAPTLHKLRSAGKKLFLLTNSRWEYTEKMMTYLLGDAMPEYPSFRHYFDVIIVSAQKPTFFQERRPLMVRDGAEIRPATLPLERGAIYEGGNLLDVERFLNVSGDRVLYVGDHIYGDILRSKKESAWRTAMIIQEMEAEVLAHEACRDHYAQSAQLEARREELEDQLRFYQQRFKDLTRQIDESPRTMGGANGSPDATPPVRIDYAVSFLEAERARAKRTVERIRGQLRAVDADLARIEREVDRHFHPFWGSLLKEANEVSSFGDQVEEYACIYTSRVSNLLGYSPLQTFRSPRDLMPHEL